MECCNYEGRVAHYWDYSYPYGYGYSHYPRYYRYDYPPAPQAHHNDHAMHMDYSVYAQNDARARRSMSRRHSPAQHLPLPSTPPLECGVSGRGAPYFEPQQMWSHYQMGMGGGSWGGGASAGWPARSCFREHMRYAPIKTPHMNHNSLYPMDGRSTPFNSYEHNSYGAESNVRPGISDYPTTSHVQESRLPRDRVYEEPKPSPPEEKRPPIVPLPAFQQAFGSTERGKFAEAFSRTEAATLDKTEDNFVFDSFPEWDASADPDWPTQPSREIKCEDTY